MSFCGYNLVIKVSTVDLYFELNYVLDCVLRHSSSFSQLCEHSGCSNIKPADSQVVLVLV